MRAALALLHCGCLENAHDHGVGVSAIPGVKLLSFANIHGVGTVVAMLCQNPGCILQRQIESLPFKLLNRGLRIVARSRTGSFEGLELVPGGDDLLDQYVVQVVR